MNLIIYCVAFLLSAVTMGQNTTDVARSAFFLRHPQEQFCSADFGKSDNILSRTITVMDVGASYTPWLNL